MQKESDSTKLIKLIADNNFHSTYNGRFIILENPDFREDNEDDKYKIFDTKKKKFLNDPR